MSDSELLVYIADRFVGIDNSDLNLTEKQIVTRLCDNGYLHLKQFTNGKITDYTVERGRKVSS